MYQYSINKNCELEYVNEKVREVQTSEDGVIEYDYVSKTGEGDDTFANYHAVQQTYRKGRDITHIISIIQEKENGEDA